MTKTLATAAALAACTVFACGGDDTTIIGSEGARLTVFNDSSFVIDELYLTPEGSPTWGSDRLEGLGLFPGEEFTLFQIPCGFYDALVVDELGAECVIEGVDLCFDDNVWVIDDAELAFCDTAFASNSSGG